MYTKQTLKITYQFQVITKHTLHNQQIITFLSLKEYNAEYSNGENPLKKQILKITYQFQVITKRTLHNQQIITFLSLKEYNAEYSKGENPLNK